MPAKLILLSRAIYGEHNGNLRSETRRAAGESREMRVEFVCKRAHFIWYFATHTHIHALSLTYSQYISEINSHLQHRISHSNVPAQRVLMQHWTENNRIKTSQFSRDQSYYWQRFNYEIPLAILYARADAAVSCWGVASDAVRCVLIRMLFCVMDVFVGAGSILVHKHNGRACLCWAQTCASRVNVLVYKSIKTNGRRRGPRAINMYYYPRGFCEAYVDISAVFKLMAFHQLHAARVYI